MTYYIDRLSMLSQYARKQKVKEKAVFMRYRDLVEDTSKTLLNLKEFLGLQTELSERYDTFKFTGSSGDPGQNIRLGRINRKRQEYQLDIPSGDLARIEEAYVECLQIMKENILLIK